MTVTHLRGISRLTIDAVTGVTTIVEEMHRNIAGLSPVVGSAPKGGARGISGFVYRGVRGVTRVVGKGIDVALAPLAGLTADAKPTEEQDAIVSVFNGVLGDHLAASGNPLAIDPQLRRAGLPLTLERKALTEAIPRPTDKLVVLVHGLCMNDRQWRRRGHDHGALLARDLGFTAVYLHYNTGRHISENGRALSALLEALVRNWPVPLHELVIVGHSMGGLVTRSACHHAAFDRTAWLPQLTRLAFLGAPHHGAPLERAGHRADIIGGISPYIAPLSRLGRLRSAGIKDLRHGNLRDEDWCGNRGEGGADTRLPVPLPAGVSCFAVAANRRSQARGRDPRHGGDGLVPVSSALGEHADATHALTFPDAHKQIVEGLGHFDLLSSRRVYNRLRRWLDPRPNPGPRAADAAR